MYFIEEGGDRHELDYRFRCPDRSDSYSVRPYPGRVAAGRQILVRDATRANAEKPALLNRVGSSMKYIINPVETKRWASI